MISLEPLSFYRCGVFVCLDCYQHRKGGLIKEQDQLDKNSYRDEYNWPFCTTGESHQIHKLLLAQIIPKNELVQLAHKVHQLRSDLGLNQFCHKKEDFKEAYSKTIMVSDTLGNMGQKWVKNGSKWTKNPELTKINQIIP